jgi:hypothetical protein
MTPEHRANIRKLLASGMWTYPIAHSEDGLTFTAKDRNGTVLKTFTAAEWDAKTHSIMDTL